MAEQEIQVFKIIQDIKSGQMFPGDLSKDLRQEVVNVLRSQGSSVSQMASFLSVSEKTVGRDVEASKKKNALVPNVELARKIVGDLVVKADGHGRHLMTLARDHNASVSEKSSAEFYAWRVSKELIDKLQSLGYLPSVSQKVTADIYHHDEDEVIDLKEMKKELSAIENEAQQEGILDDEIKKKIHSLQFEIDKEEIVKEVKKEEVTNETEKENTEE